MVVILPEGPCFNIMYIYYAWSLVSLLFISYLGYKKDFVPRWTCATRARVGNAPNRRIDASYFVRPLLIE
jgi:hypothetical protein